MLGLKGGTIFAGLLLSASVSQAELQITANQNIWAVPSTSKSCKAWNDGQEQDNIKSKYINLGNLSFLWSNPKKDFRIREIRVSIRDKILKGGEYKCSVVGDELLALGMGDWLTIKKSASHQYTYVGTDCAMLCGGIEFAEDIAGTMNGKIEVVGNALEGGAGEEQVYGLPLQVDNLEF
ncbi:hypothetical protein [Bdellovibrio sp. KM01]|uniref:hypothetical protein n=1 Tax=Bdellovibrio sp. KM01 TaxID=2748865 RepID=UPI0015E92FE6|nr:hypothetical protein [Bdellovibrio sp. KM01]QLY23983.1 hypothetical protein HW988_10885 [Bdellovibrio sp. KM01]